MKTRLPVIILFAAVATAGYSQISDKKSGFTDVRLSYIISSMSAGGDHFRKDETIIPYGAGLELTFDLSRRFFFDFGTGFRTTGRRIQDHIVISEWGYSGPVHRDYTDLYLDIPVHFNFRIINTKLFKMIIFSGPKGTIYHDRNYYNPDDRGQEVRYHLNSFHAGLDFGLMECLRVTHKIGVFTSQYYGYYLFGFYSECETINFKIGLSCDL